MARLNEIAIVTSGNSAPQKPALFENGVYPFVRTGDVGRVHRSTNFTHPEDYLNDEGVRGMRLFPKGAILIPKSGASTLLNHRVILGEDSYVVSHLAVVIPRLDKAISEYIYYAMAHIDVGNLVDDRAYPSLKTSTIGEINIPLPSLSEQKRIVTELNLLTGVIDKQKQQLKELDNLSLSIFYDMFGNPVENEKGWGKKTIGEVCTLKSGNSSANNSSEGDLPYVKVGDMNIPENIPFITTSSTFVDREENRRNILPIGTIIFPKRGGAIYTNKKRITSVEICCDLNTMGVIPSECLLSSYLYYYFLTLDFGEICNGAAIPQLNNIDIAPLPIGIPPIERQKSFDKHIQEIESQKKIINRSIAESQKLFDYTMDKYFG